MPSRARRGGLLRRFRIDGDQRHEDGQRQTLDSLKGPKGLVLVFSRSADWCPYCKTQLADLNQQAEGFRRRGLGVASLTYDSVDVLRNFAARIGIR